MYSQRFAKEIVVTAHARSRMKERGIDEATLAALLETGGLKRVDGVRLFIFKHFPGRHDNLVSAAAVDDAALVIKTVMVNWTLRGES